MQIEVTRHAIKRYRERLFDYSSSEEAIRQKLTEIARQGKHVHMRPSTWKNCAEVGYSINE